MSLVATGIRKAYPGLEILRGADLSVAEGETVAVRGASGTGKSTLLHCLGLLDRLDAGEIRLGERRIDTLAGKERAKVRAREIGFVFQGFHLLPEFDVLENVLLAARAAGGDLGRARHRALTLLERVGLADFSRRDPRTLSGGERQRAALCRSLVNRPALLLADEPTGNLDPATATVVLEQLLDLARADRAAVVVVTHDTQVAARCDRRLELRDGTLRPDV